MAEAVILPAELDGDTRRKLLEHVDEIQRGRAGGALAPADVPHILLPYQARWHADDSPIRICRKSRRIGFSWGALAAEAVLEAAQVRGGMDQFYMGFNQQMAAEFIGDCAFFARAYQEALSAPVFMASAIDVRREIILIENERRDLITYSVRLASGRRIEALSSNPHNWRGKQGHARVDEAAFHDNLAEVVKGALAFKMWGGRVSIVSTHNGDDNEFNRLVKAVEAGKLPWSLHTVTFDDALREGFYRRVCLVRGITWTPEGQAAYRAEVYADYPNQEDADEELGVIPKRGSGTYFPRALIEKCWQPGIPVLRFNQPAAYVLDPARLEVVRAWLHDVVKPVIDAMPTDARTVFGQDFGRSGDLSVIWVLQHDGGTRWRTPFITELRNIPFDVQYLILCTIIDWLPHWFHGKLDSRGNGQAHAEAAMQQYGPERIECVMLSAPWYAAHFPLYKAAYEDGDIIVPCAEDIATDHRRIKLSAGRPAMDDGKDKGTDGGQRHGDSAVAGLLAWAATMTEQEAYGYTPVPRDRSALSEAHHPDHSDDAHPWASSRRTGW